MSYTKGPLEIENATEREGEPIYKVVRIEYGLKSVLATCYDMALCEEHGGTALGNAQLYRAAPQLLEALKAIRTLYEDAANSNGEVFLDESEIGRIAETALAAAQGKD